MNSWDTVGARMRSKQLDHIHMHIIFRWRSMLNLYSEARQMNVIKTQPDSQCFIESSRIHRSEELERVIRLREREELINVTVWVSARERKYISWMGQCPPHSSTTRSVIHLFNARVTTALWAQSIWGECDRRPLRLWSAIKPLTLTPTNTHSYWHSLTLTLTFTPANTH